VTDIGSEPERFARQLIDGIAAREGQPGLFAYLRGVGTTIADEMPQEFWDLAHALAQRSAAEGRPPTLCILSQEPYVPWELAVADPPLVANGASPFLGAQAAIGRWVLGQRRPKLPPPTDVSVKDMVVISGVYDQPGWNRLIEAEEEAAAIQREYAAVGVHAAATDILRCMGGMPRADVLHFAMHGIYDPNSVLNGLVLVDGSTLDPLQVKGHSLSSAPFVFLNACQVGSANKILGDYSGMAEAFLYAGAAGVIAPLWSIKDSIAREIALDFYRQVFAGRSPAEVLRTQRATFHDAPEPASATFLGYVFYGHPGLRLTLRPVQA
jgi:hypothetical protein